MIKFAPLEFSIIDPDGTENTILTFSIVGGNDDGFFRVDPPTGYLFLESEIDRDFGSPSHLLTLRVSDGTFSSQFNVNITVIDVNDNTPLPAQSTFFGEVNEELPPSTLVQFPLGGVEFTDADTGVNAEITYFLDPSQNDFAILDPTSGAIVTNRTFDFDSGDTHFNFQVFARDGGDPQNVGSANVVIAVLDTNDNRPMIEATLVPNASYCEEGPAVRVADVVVMEADTFSILYALVRVTDALDTGEELASVPSPGFGTAYSDDTLLIIGQASAAQISQLLSNTVYINPSEEISLPLQRTIEYSVCDQLLNDVIPSGLSQDAQRALEGVSGNASLNILSEDVIVLLQSCEFLVSSSVILPMVQINDQPSIDLDVRVRFSPIMEDVPDDENLGQLLFNVFSDAIQDNDQQNSFPGIAVVGHGSPAQAEAGLYAFSNPCAQYHSNLCASCNCDSCSGVHDSLFCTPFGSYIFFTCLHPTTATNWACIQNGRKRRQASTEEFFLDLGSGPIDITSLSTMEASDGFEQISNLIFGNGRAVVIVEGGVPVNETLTPFNVTYVSLNDTDDFNAMLLGPLNPIRFIPNPQATGEAIIFYKAWDGTNGVEIGETVDTMDSNVKRRDTSSGQPTNGGSLSNETGNATIEIMPMNDPPEIYLGGPGVQNFTANYTENGVAAFVSSRDAEIIEHDDDDLFLNNLRVYITKEDGSCDLPDYPSNSSDTLEYISIPQVDPVEVTRTGQACILYIFNGRLGIDTWRSFLTMIRFRVLNEEPSDHTRRLSFVISDDNETDSEPSYTYIDVSLVSDICPEVEVSTSMPLAYVEHNGSVVVDGGLIVSDGDRDAEIEQAEVRIIGTCSNCTLMTTVFSPLISEVPFDGSALILIGPATPADFQDVLRSVVFYDTADEPSFDMIQVRFTLIDDTLAPSVCSDSFGERVIVIQHINDNAPELYLNFPTNLRSFTATFIEGAGSTPLTGTQAGNVLIIDMDGEESDIYRIEVQITTGCIPSEDVLEFVNPQPTTLVQSYNLISCTLELRGNKDDLESDLLRLRYRNADIDNPTDQERLITFTISDDPLESLTSTTVLSIFPINDRPVIDLDILETGSSDSNVAFRIGMPSVSVTGPNGGGITDPDDTLLEEMVLVIAEFTLDDDNQLVEVNPRSDILFESLDAADSSLLGSLGLTGTYSVNTGELRITGSATVADYLTALNDIIYINNRVPPTLNQRQITVTVSDGDLSSEQAIAFVSFEGGANPPRVDLNGNVAGTNTDVTYTTTEPAVHIAPDAFVSDQDEDTICNINVTLTGPSETCSPNSVIFETSGFSDIELMTTNQGDTTVYFLETVFDDCRDMLVIQRIIQDMTFLVPDTAEPGICTLSVRVTDFTGISSNTAVATVEVKRFNAAPFIDLDLGLPGRDYSTVYFQGGNIEHIVSIFDEDLAQNITVQTPIGEADGEAPVDDGTFNHGVVIEEESHAGYTLIDIDSPEIEYLQVEFVLSTTLEYDVIRYPCSPLPSDERGCTNIGESSTFIAPVCNNDVFEACEAGFDLCSDLQVTVFCSAVGKKAYRFVYLNDKSTIRHERLLGYLGYEYLLERGGDTSQIRIINVTAFDGEKNNNNAYTRVRLRNQDILIIIVDPPPPNVTFHVYEDERVVHPTPYELLLYQVQVMRLDGTIPDPGTVEFNITDGNTGDAFKISDLGEIMLANSLDREAIPEYNLTVSARSLGAPLDTTSFANLIIGVLDVNDNHPVVTDSFTVNITEGGMGGQFLVSVGATDVDEGINAELSYLLLGIGAEYFRVDNNGVVRTRIPLNVSDGDYFLLVMIICDRGETMEPGEPYLCTHTVINVYLIALPSTALQLEPHPVIDLFEDTPVDERIGQLEAFEIGGEGDPNLVRFQITEIVPGSTQTSEDPPPFRVNEITGEIFVNAELDAEREVLYFVSVEAFSIRTTPPPPMPANRTITVNVLDINEFEPTFVGSPYTIDVAENTGISTTVFTLVASDSDAMDMGGFIFTIISAPAGLPFNVEPDGDIVLTSAIDYERNQSYMFTVEVHDDPAFSMPQRSNTTDVTVIVLDRNDNPPVFLGAPFVQSVRETVSVGYVVISFDTIDIDSPINQDVTYSVVGIDNTPFCLVDTTIQVCNATTLTLIEAEPTVFPLLIVATNPPGVGSSVTQQSSEPAEITLVLVNEFAPEFPEPVIIHQGYFEEHCSDLGISGSCIGVQVYDFGAVATDRDGGVSGQLIFSLAASNVPFTIDSSTGVVTITERIDREVEDSYTLEILAVDGADVDGTVRNSSVTLFIPIYDIDDNAPIHVPPFNFTVNEIMTQTGEVFGQIEITDPDINGTREYHILVPSDPNEQPGCFNTDNYNSPSFIPVQIDRNSGELFFCVPIDFETDRTFYEFEVRVRDTGRFDVGPDLSDFAVYTADQIYNVMIVDANDQRPMLDQPDYTFTHDENTAVGSGVGTIAATDSDSGLNGLVRYSVSYNGDTTCSEDLPFQIDEFSGVLRTCLPLDYELRQQYEFTVEACDSGAIPMCDSAPVTVNVTDRNDNPPVFVPPQYEVAIPETDTSLNDTFVVELFTTDSDSLPNSIAVFVFLTTGTPFGFRNPTPSSIEVYVANASLVDYDNGPREYILQIQAINLPENITDETQFATATIRINITDVNDNSPQIFDPLQFEILENVSVLSEVGCIDASDADSGLNGELDYNLGDFVTGFFQCLVPEAPFMIDRVSGCITTCEELDYEVMAWYTLPVTVCDRGSPSPLCTTASIQIHLTDLNDNEPIFVDDPLVVNVNENSLVGASVTLVNSTDADSPPNSLISYEFLNTTAPFEIRSENEIYYSGPEELDFEGAIRSYILHLRGTNRPEISGDETHIVDIAVTINVVDRNDNPPVFDVASANVTIDEHSAIGNLVYTIDTTDVDTDANSQVRYVILEPGMPFMIVGNEVLVADNVSTDFDPPSSIMDYVLTIQAINEPAESGDETQRADLTLIVTLRDINDNAPQCLGPLGIILPENTPVSVPLPNRVMATDIDSGANAALEFRIEADGDPLCSFEQPFQIDPDSGFFTVCFQLDFEVTREYNLNITVCDRGTTRMCSTCPITISIADVNDNAPEINPPTDFSVMETVSLEFEVGCLNATDDDMGQNAVLDYSIIGTECTSDIPFRIVTTNELGCIRVCQLLDFETVDRYEFEVNVTDNGDPILSNTTTVTITIINENDNIPIITSPNITEVVEEQENATVITVTAEDIDDPPYNSTTFQFLDNAGGRFRIDPITGTIETTVALDREIQSFYIVTVQVSDGEFSSTQTLMIDLVDINDNPPTYIGPAIYTIMEELIPFELFIPFQDDDIGINAALTYEVNDSRLTVDSSGVLSNLVQLDRDDSSSNISIQVTARDGGDPTMTGMADVMIVLTDINDNPPIPLPPFEYEILDGSLAGTEVFTSMATDADEGDNARLTFSIGGGRNGGSFNISETTGLVRLTEDIFLTSGSFDALEVIVNISDNGIPQRVTPATYTVFIISEVPQFTEPRYDCIISENRLDSLINCTSMIQATDRDNNPFNDEYVFSFVNVTPYDTGFRIESMNDTGTIFTPIDYLDFEDAMQFEIVLGVSRVNMTSIVDDTTLVVIVVTEQNDNPPFLSPANITGELPENAPDDYIVATAVAIDFDVGLSGRLTYNLSGDGEEFIFDSVGNLLVRNASLIDYESNMNFTFTYQACDGGTPQFCSEEGYIFITVVNVDDLPPIFDPDMYDTAIAEDFGTDRVVLHVQYSDPDTPRDQITLSLSPPQTLFEIVQISGALMTTSIPIDREVSFHHAFSVIATDTAGQRAVAGVFIQVLDRNDVRPRVEPAEITVYFREDEGTAFIGQNLSVVDEDDISIFPLTRVDISLHPSPTDSSNYPLGGGICDHSNYSILFDNNVFDLCGIEDCLYLLGADDLTVIGGSLENGVLELPSIGGIARNRPEAEFLFTGEDFLNFTVSIWTLLSVGSGNIFEVQSGTDDLFVVGVAREPNSDTGVLTVFKSISETQTETLLTSVVLPTHDSMWHQISLQRSNNTLILYFDCEEAGRSENADLLETDGFVDGTFFIGNRLSGFFAEMYFCKFTVEREDICCTLNCGESFEIATPTPNVTANINYRTRSVSLEYTGSDHNASLPALDEALKNVMYINKLGEPHPLDRGVFITAEDSVGPSDERAVVTLSPILINDQKPVLDLNGIAVAGIDLETTFSELTDGTLIIGDNTILYDEDSGFFPVNRIEIDLVDPSPNLEFLFTTSVPDGFNISILDSGTRVLITSSSPSDERYPDQYLDALRAVQYVNIEEEPGEVDKMLVFTVYDEGAVHRNDPLSVTTVTVLPTNDQPVLDLDTTSDDTRDTSTVYLEQFGFVKLLNGLTQSITDPDSSMISNAIFVLTERPDGDLESLRVDEAALPVSVTWNFDTATGTLGIQGTHDFNTWLVILRAVDYVSDNRAPVLGQESQVSVQVVDDGGGVSEAAFVSISYVLFNDPPEIYAGGPGVRDHQAVFIEDGPCIPIASPNLTVIEHDSRGIFRVEVRLQETESTALESIIFPGDPSEHPPFTLVLSGTRLLLNLVDDSPASYQQQLPMIVYCNDIEEPDETIMRRVRFVATDTDLGISEQTFTTITIIRVNDRPVVEIQPINNISIGGVPTPIINPETISVADPDDLLFDELIIYITNPVDGRENELIEFARQLPETTTSIGPFVNDDGEIFYEVTFREGGATRERVIETISEIRYTNQAGDITVDPPREVCVTVQDFKIFSFRVCVNVTISPPNDFTPEFLNDPADLEFTFDETDSEVFIVQLQATDSDPGLAGELQYSISLVESTPFQGTSETTTSLGLFDIDVVMGQLTAPAGLQAEDYGSHVVTIVASDMGNPTRSASIEVRITIQDVNDEAPVFIGGPYTAVEQREELSPPRTVITVSAIDEDVTSPNNIIANYNLEGSNSQFSINPSTGLIQYILLLDADEQEVYVLNVSAVDSGSPPLTSYTTVTFTLIDINDNAAEVDQLATALSVVGGEPRSIGPAIRIVDRDIIGPSIIELSIVLTPNAEDVSRPYLTCLTQCQEERLQSANLLNNAINLLDLATFQSDNNNPDAFSEITIGDGGCPGYQVVRASVREDDGYGRITRSQLPADFGSGEFSVSFVAALQNEGFIFIVPDSDNPDDPTNAVERELALWIRSRDIRFYYTYSSSLQARATYQLSPDDPFDFFFLGPNAVGGPQSPTRHYVIVVREDDDIAMAVLDIYVDCQLLTTLTLAGTVVISNPDIDVFIGQSRPPPVTSGRLGANLHGLYYHNVTLNASQIQSFCCGVEELRLPKPLPDTIDTSVEDPYEIVLLPTGDRIPEEDALAVLRSIIYVNSYEPPTLNPDRQLDFTIREQGLSISGESTGFIKLVLEDDSLPEVDLNGVTVGGINYEIQFIEDGGAVPIVSSGVRMTREIEGGFVIPTFDRIIAELLNAVDPSESLSAVEVRYITVNISGDQHTVTIIGPGIAADFIPVLQSLTYNNNEDRPSHDELRSIQFTIVDTEGRVNNPLAFTTVNVTALNDEPEFFLTSTGALEDSIIFVEGTAEGILVAPNATLRDVDNDNIVGANISLGSPNLADDFLSFTAHDRVIGIYDSATGVLALTGETSLADYTEVIQSILFHSNDSPFLDNNGQPVSDPTRNITIVITDGNFNSPEAVVTVEFRPIDDPPIVTLLSDNLNFTDGDAPLLIADGAEITDADNERLSSMTISLVNPVPAENDMLSDGVQSRNSLSYDEDTLANYVTILQSVVYINNAPEPSLTEPSRTVQIEVCDFGPIDDCARAEIIINILDRNDNSPTFSEDIYTFTIEENIAGFVGTLQVEDIDQLEQEFTFSITDSDVPFRIEKLGEQNAQVISTEALDFESTPEYNFTVWVLDGINVGTTTVIVEVININEPPTIDDSQIDSTVVGRPDAETTLIQGGDIVLSDPDEGDVVREARLQITGIPLGSDEMLALIPNITGYSFSITDPVLHAFSLVNTSSNLSLAEALNNIQYVAGSEVTDLIDIRFVSIVVLDQNGLVSEDEVTIEVSLASIPEFIGAPYQISLVEGQLHQDFLQVVATVESGGPVIEYDIETGVGVTIDSVSGQLSLSNILDHETDQLLEFMVFAIDNLTPARTGTAMVNITVLDANDVRPELGGLDDLTIESSIPVDLLPNVTVTDPDSASDIELARVTIIGQTPLVVSPFTGNTCVDEYNAVFKMSEVCGLDMFIDLLENDGPRRDATLNIDEHGNRILYTSHQLGYTQILADFSPFQGVLVDFTFAVWLQPEASGYIAYYGLSDGTERYFALYYDADENQLVITFKRLNILGLSAQVRINFQLPNPINDGDWHFVMIQYSSRDLFLALDGSVVGSSAVVYKEDSFIGQVFGTYVCVYVCVFVCMCMCVCSCVHVYVCARTLS